MRCPNCSSDIPEGRKFCGHCGHRLTTAASPTPKSVPPKSSRPSTPTRQPAADVLTTEILVTQVEAIRIVKKGLEGTLLKKERIDEDAPKVQLPLWRVHCKVRKGLFGRQQIDEYLYFSAHNGKLLTLDRKELRFTDIVDVKAHRITDLDGTARFTRRPLNQLASEPITPRVSREVIKEKAREMFGVEVVDARLLLFPVWQFTVVHKRTGEKRQVLIDTTFGRQVT